MHKGEYTIVHKDPAEQEREEQAILAGINRPYEETRDEEEDLADEDLMDDELSDELDEESDDELDEDSDEELEETEAPFEPDEN
jgi:hypothetical protein